MGGSHEARECAGFARLGRVPAGCAQLARRFAEGGAARAGAAIAAFGKAGRLLALALLLLFCAPYPAYGITAGDTGRVWGPTLVNAEHANQADYEYGQVIIAGNNFDAALCAIDGDIARKIQIDSAMFAKLSNSETGGRFYELAQTVQTYAQRPNTGWGAGGAAGVPGGAGFDWTISGFAAMYGADNVWTLQCTQGFLASAKEDLETILDGGSLGGGGGSGIVSGDYLEFNVLLGTCPSSFTNSNQPFYFQNALDNLYYGNRIRSVADGSSSSKNIKLPDVIKVRFPLSVFSPTPVNGEVYFLRFYGNTCQILKSDDNNSYTLNTGTYTVSQNDISYTSSYYSLYGIFYSFNNTISYTNKRFSYSDGVATYVGTSTINAKTTTTAQDFTSVDVNGMPTYGCIGTNVNSGGGQPDPPNNWPDDNSTVAPSPPELPTPTYPTVPTTPPPTVTTPDPQPPTITGPIVITEPTGTDATDYTPWLRAILQQLIAIANWLDSFGDTLLLELTNHCEHIQDSISTGFYGLESHETNLFSWAFGTGGPLETDFLNLAAYERVLTQYLVDSLSLDALERFVLSIWHAVTDGTATLHGDAGDIVTAIESLELGGGAGSADVDLSTIEGYLSDIRGWLRTWLYDSGTGDGVPDGGMLAVQFGRVLDSLTAFTSTPDYGGGGAEGYFSVADIDSFVLEELRRLAASIDGGEGVTLDVDLSNIEQSLTDIWEVVEEWHSDFAGWWGDFNAYMDQVIYDLEHLTISTPRRWGPTTNPTIPPDDETGIVPYEDVLNITALRDALTRLMSKFPFSVINNFALILTALTRPAVTPVFDLPMPNPSNWTAPYSVHVNLSEWDTAAAVMRTGIMLWVIAKLSRRTVSMWTREEGGGGD